MDSAKKTLTNYDDITLFSILLTETEAWERLQDKTQVFNDRVTDAVKTRGSHSIDVGDIAATLASGLTTDLSKIEKARLLGRLHDVGHIPFGHAGESIAGKMIEDRYENLSEKEKEDIKIIRACLFGEKYASKNTKPGFEHNENSVLQYHLISQMFGYEIDPEIVEGILAHSTSRYGDLPPTLAQQAVRLADKIAYINYDVEDLRISFQGKEEWEALKSIYSRPVLDEEEKPIVIEFDGKQYHNILEFIESLQVYERLAMFESEAIRVAIEDRTTKSSEYETVLTGGNDLIVSLSNLKKNPKYYDKKEKKWTPEGLVEKKKIKKELLRKSPLLYLSYEMKERSDEFIRSGTGLTLESKRERAKNATSSVGNEDLKNQYIYNKIVVFIENRHKINLSELPDVLKDKFEKLFQEYEEYKNKQEELISNLPGNVNKVKYPEIYTILNFIGLHSNSELLDLANDLCLGQMFEQEVLPKIQALIDNEEYYDKTNETFTVVGLRERDKIVEKYGAIMKFEYSLEENDFTPTTPEEVIAASRQYGFGEKDKEVETKKVEKSQEEIVKELHEQDHETEIIMMEEVKRHLDLQNEQQLGANGVGHGR